MSMMNNVGITPKSMHQKWQFGIEIEGFDAAYFTKSDLPEMEFDEVAFSPGGSIYDQKSAGRLKFNDITMESGEPQDGSGDAMLGWVNACVTILQNTGGLPDSYMKDIDIVQFDRTGKEIKRWRLHSSYIKSCKFGELEGGSSDVTIKTMTISYNYFTRV